MDSPRLTYRHGESVKRGVYLAVLALLMSRTVVLWMVQDIAQDPIRRVAFPLILIFSAIAFVGIATRKLPLFVGERFFLVVAAAAILPTLARFFGSPPVGTAQTALLVVAMIGLTPVFTLSFLTFGTSRGLRVALFSWLTFLAMVAPPTVTDLLDGGQVRLESTVAVFLAGSFGTTIAFLWLLASRLEGLVAARELAAVFAAQATTDPLTGRANRRAIDDELERLVARSRRNGGPLSVVLIDLDHFKGINDRFGHHAGDEALVRAVERLASTIREGDVLGRWGGDEFVVLAPHTDGAPARKLAERCSHAIASTPVAGVGHLTASFGVATLDADEGPRSLLRRADRALYTAKAEGRNRVVGQALHEPAMAPAAETVTAASKSPSSLLPRH